MGPAVALLSVIILILAGMLNKQNHTITLLSDECERLTGVIEKLMRDKNE